MPGRPPPDLAAALDPAAVAGLLDLGATLADGAPLAVVGPDGAVLAGRRPPERSSTAHPVTVDGLPVATILAGAGTPAALPALLARALELAAATAANAADRTRVAEELTIGRRIQRSLIPRRFPEVPGWTFAAAYRAAREVGGDLYDVFPLRGRPELVGLLVADVTGKGIPAALLMADARALLHAAADNADGPADALARVNRILVRERATTLFVSAALLVVHAATGGIRYASAGHEPALVARARGGRLEPLEADGPVLGAFDGASFEECDAHLAPGDALVLYTDGITETRDPSGAFFGDDRLAAAIAAHCGGRADDVAGAVMGAVDGFRGAAEPYDDLTLVVARRDGA